MLGLVMALHPVLSEKLNAALASPSSFDLTRRDARLPPIRGKVHAVIGMRRAGKTTFLHQLLSDLRALHPAEVGLFIGFDDDRLAGIDASQLNLLLEDLYSASSFAIGIRNRKWNPLAAAFAGTARWPPATT